VQRDLLITYILSPPSLEGREGRRRGRKEEVETMGEEGKGETYSREEGRKENISLPHERDT